MAPMLALPPDVWFPTSNGVEMCIDAYLEQVAKELSGEEALTTVLPAAMPERGVYEGPANHPAAAPAARAGPGHLYMCAHACLLGALTATEKTAQRMLGDEPVDFARVWEAEFKTSAQVRLACLLICCLARFSTVDNALPLCLREMVTGGVLAGRSRRHDAGGGVCVA
jgi:hypothetical protein